MRKPRVLMTITKADEIHINKVLEMDTPYYKKPRLIYQGMDKDTVGDMNIYAINFLCRAGRLPAKYGFKVID